MRPANSLALAALLLGPAPQQQPDRQMVRAQLAALAGPDENARRAAEQRLEEIPHLFAGLVRSIAADESPDLRAAARRWLPHPVWWGVLDGRIGEVRRRERELLGENPDWTLDALARAGAALAARGGAELQAGLKLLERAPAPDPRALLPMLDDPATARLALAALGRADEALALREALRRLREAPDEIARQMTGTLAELGTSDLTPALVEILKVQPGRAEAVVGLLEKIGDARAEEALIEHLAVAPAAARPAVVQALAMLGGPKAVAALRSHRDALPAGDLGRRTVKDALVRLRDPGMSRDLIASGEWGGELLRLGDRGAAAQVVESLRSGRLKVKERQAALELLGVIGSAGELDLLLEHLGDGRFRVAAAAALRELGEARAARPLAEALATTAQAGRVARALATLPLEEAEGSLLELLEDPESNAGATAEAIVLAARLGSPAVKQRLSALVADSRSMWALPAALALGPLLEPGERDALRGRLPPKDEARRTAGLLALALSGDLESVGPSIRAWRGGWLGYDPLRGAAVRLLLGGEAGLRALELEVKAHPEWLDGAEALALRGRDAAREALLLALESPQRMARNRAAVGLAGLGRPAALRELFENGESNAWEPEMDAVVAKAVDDRTASRLRFWAWALQYHGNAAPARVLARRGDAEMASFFRKALRRESVDNAVYPSSNTPALAEALAALGRADARPTFLRLLRSRAATMRALGARVLAKLDGHAAIAPLLPLLDDGEELPDGRRVREEVVDVLEGLAGRAFQGTPRARVEAARRLLVK